MNRNKIPNYIENELVESFDGDRNAYESFLLSATPEEVFERWCDYIGLINWSDTIWKVVFDLYNSQS